MRKKLTFFALLCFTLLGYAQNTFVPDDNFEQALIDLGYDTGALDNQVPTANINTITSLNVANKNIADLTGIQDFVALTQLFFSNNQLTSLNVSANTALTYLDCSSNQLSSLDVSANTALIYLQCSFNLLTSLGVSTNTALTYLGCSSNLLTNLDVNANTALTYFFCYKNQLTSLNVSTNTALTYLDCSSNLLTSLDLDANTALTYLHCNSNQLTTLNVKNGNNTNMPGVNFYAANNPDLVCFQVDDVSYSTVNWTNIDAGTSFSTNCALGTENFSLFDFQYYPNPISNTLTLKANQPIDEVTIFNLLGQQVIYILPGNNEKIIDMNSLNANTYFVKVNINNTIKTFKIIKQ